MEIHQYWNVPRYTQRTTTPSLVKKWRLQYNHWRKGRKLEWQHPSRTSPSRWRGCNHHSHHNLRQDLADRRMANPVDPVLGHHSFQERQLAAVPELPNDLPHQSTKQSHAEDHAELIETGSGEHHCWRTGRLPNRKEQHRADLQTKNPLWEISPAPPCFL